MTLAEEYHRLCDRYDEIHCTGRRNGEAVPANGKEMAMTGKNARHVLRELSERGNISESELHRAIVAMARKQ